MVYEHIKDMKTIGILDRDEANKTYTIAAPVGVIAGLIPSTNPTSTAFINQRFPSKLEMPLYFHRIRVHCEASARQSK